MLYVWGFILEVIKEIAIGIGLLILGLIVVPENVTSWIINKIKPAIFLAIHAKWERLLQYITNVFIIHDSIDFEDNVVLRNKFDKITSTEQYVSQIEKNLYFVDLSIDLLRTLDFACPGSIGSMSHDLVSQSMNYLQNYLRKIEYDEQDPGFSANISRTLETIGQNYDELSELRRSKDNDGTFKIIEQHAYKQAIQQFNDYRIGLENRLRLNRNEQRLTIREIADEIKKHPKRIGENSRRNTATSKEKGQNRNNISSGKSDS